MAAPAALAVAIGTAAVPGRIAAADSWVIRSFDVTVLPTRGPGRTSAPPTYVAAVLRRIPARHAALLTAYGVAGRIFLAPRGWTGSGVFAGAKGATATLRATARSPVAAGTLDYRYEDSCWGCAIDDAARYFVWPREHWTEVRAANMPLPPARRLVRKVYVTPRLIAYQAPDTSVGLEVNGLIYSSIDERPHTTPLLMRVEVTLPHSQHALATTMLDTSGHPGY